MYVKLFSSILHSSIWSAPSDTRLVWITMLAMADLDGYVRAAPSGLARAANVPLDACLAALAILEGPDPESGTEEYEGRRIEAVPGGWMLLNYAKYRNMVDPDTVRAQTRERVQRHRAKKKAKPITVSNGNAPVTVGNGRLRQAEAEAEANIYVRFWATYPPRAGSNPRKDAEKAIRARMAAGISSDTLLEGAARYRAYCEATGSIGTQYVKMATSWLSPTFEGWAQPWTAPQSNGRDRNQTGDEYSEAT